MHVYRVTPVFIADDSCTEAGYDRQCCEGSVDQCLSPSSSCSCDTSCFQREDCCEDIFSMHCVTLCMNHIATSLYTCVLKIERVV